MDGARKCRWSMGDRKGCSRANARTVYGKYPLSADAVLSHAPFDDRLDGALPFLAGAPFFR